ncbi:MAG: LamG-like jellyroll fold domain-containing protein, partial [Bacteroidota bacterium]
GSGKAYDFNSAKITIPNSSSLNPTNLTLEAWIKADSWQPSVWQGSILSKDGWATGDNGYCLRVGANGSVSFNIGNTGWHEAVSSALMGTNEWYHIAGTYDGSLIKVYINGVLANTTVYTGVVASTTYNLTIGDFAYAAIGGNRYFDGQIDEARVWSTALTEAQIREYMCKKVTSSHPQYANLSGYWNMDPTGAVTDQSPNGNNGTVTSATQVNSGAPIGNASVYSYLSAPNLSLAFGTMDTAIVTSSSALPLTHLYRVDGLPVVTNTVAIIDSLDQTHYYGVYVNPTPAASYSFAYHYGSNPFAAGGNETYTNLGVRATGSTSPWAAATTTQNQTINTLTYSATGRKEMILTLNCQPVSITPSSTQNLCAGDSILLQVNSAVTNIQWLSGGTPITGVTSPTFYASTTGNYTVSGNSGICAATSTAVNVTVHPIPTVNFGDLPSNSFCVTDGLQNITNSVPATGGTFTGPGIFGNTFTPNMAPVGTHTLYYNYSDPFGCSNVDSFIVTLGATPPAPVITQTGFQLCTPACGTFTWSLGGNVITGATTNCYTATANGIYSVYCTTPEGCVSTTANSTVAGVGLEEFSWANNIEIAPNPTSDIVNIFIPNEAKSNLEFNVVDVNGRMILSDKVVGSKINLDLSNFESGVYILSIHNTDGQLVRRLIKE